MKKFIAIILLTWITSVCNAQTKRALLIGISTYNTSKTSWGQIHGTNDVALLRTALLSKGVRNITELRNEAATYQGICNALENLIHQSGKGDVVYIHMSGHGQPIEDENGDEKDGWDESFIPYDAINKYKKNYYEGEKHLTDDIINKYLEKLRVKIGFSGFVYVSIDACHSGDSYRDDEDNTDFPDNQDFTEISIDEIDTQQTPVWSMFQRGSAEGFSKKGKNYSACDIIVQEIIPIKHTKSKSPIVIMESCLSTQRSYEIKLKMREQDFYCGPLSYVIYKVLTNNSSILSKDFSWVKRVKNEFLKILPKNNPQKLVIETTYPKLCK